MSSSPYQSEILEKKRNMDVLGRQIDNNLLTSIRKRTHHTPLQSTSKYILSNDLARNRIPKDRFTSEQSIMNSQKAYSINNNSYDNNYNYQPEPQVQSQPFPQQDQHQQQLDHPRAFSNNISLSRSQPHMQYDTFQKDNRTEQKGPIMRYNEPYSEYYGSNVEPDNRPKLMPGEYDRGFDFTKNDRYLYKHSPYPKYPMLDPLNNRIGKGHLSLKDQYQYYQEAVHYNKQFHRDRVGEGNGSRYKDLAIYPTMKDVMTPLDKSRSDYDNSRFGDYTYNFFLNAPMRANVSEDWKYPPEYYYNGRFDPKTRSYVSH